MTVAKNIFGGIGARPYLPEGPYGTLGNTPFPSFADGDVMMGELAAEYEFVRIAVAAAFTVNQGDVFVWDNSGMAVQAVTGSAAHPFGASVGTAFLGGRVGELNGLAVPGNVWSYTFPLPGVYGMWMQRAGKSVINCATINAQTKPLNTTAVQGQVNAPSSALSGSMGISNAWTCLSSWTFLGALTSGSAVITGVQASSGQSQNALSGLTKGQQLSGTGIATGAVIIDIQGSTVTMSLAATATESSETITAKNLVALGTTTNGSAALTNVTTIAGMYPNATIAGTGIPSSTTILSITGDALGGYTINMSANATATANNIALTSSIYTEAFLMWPYIGSQN